MRRLILISLFAPAIAVAAGKQVTVSVKGMVCAFCAQGITKKLKAESVVKNVDVSLERKEVKIELKDGADIPNEKIESILKDSGYNVEKIARQ